MALTGAFSPSKHHRCQTCETSPFNLCLIQNLFNYFTGSQLPLSERQLILGLVRPIFGLFNNSSSAFNLQNWIARFSSQKKLFLLGPVLDFRLFKVSLLSSKLFHFRKLKWLLQSNSFYLRQGPLTDLWPVASNQFILLAIPQTDTRRDLQPFPSRIAYSLENVSILQFQGLYTIQCIVLILNEDSHLNSKLAIPWRFVV